jgi:hypothetical protein
VKSSCYFIFNHSGTSELKFFWTHSSSLQLVCLLACSHASATTTTHNCLWTNSVTLTYIATDQTCTCSKYIPCNRYPASLLVHWSDLQKTHHFVYPLLCDVTTDMENTASSVVACCTIRAVAWQPVNQICYTAPSLRLFVPHSLTVYHLSFLPGSCAFNVLLQVGLSLSLSLPLPPLSPLPLLPP